MESYGRDSKRIPFNLVPDEFWKPLDSELKDLEDVRNRSDPGYCIACKKYADHLSYTSSSKFSSFAEHANTAAGALSIPAAFGSMPAGFFSGILWTGSALATSAASADSKTMHVYLSLIVCADGRIAIGAKGYPMPEETDSLISGTWQRDRPGIGGEFMANRLIRSLGSWVHGKPGGKTGVLKLEAYDAYGKSK